MSNKTLLIVERSESKLSSHSEEDKYVLEGIFTEVGIKNNNNRIYDEKELIPHIDELKKMCENNKLLGELDHPKSFDISLQNASHIIESIDYNKDKKQVTGRIRLLNTDAGKNARALVDAGVPLHISSRAAGVVENNGHVKIKKMFTYDLVANPGFTNAELKRVNESFGFDNENIGIFEIPTFWELQNSQVTNEENKTQENKIKEMDNNKYISVDDFNQYTKLVKNEFENLKRGLDESASKNTDEDKKGVIKYAESIAKQVNSMQEKILTLTENVDGLVSHNDYIIENLEKVKNYAELIGERSNMGINYSEKLTESVDYLIEYTKLVAEKSDQSIEYAKMIAEKTDQSIQYSNMIAEETSNRWRYQQTMNETLDNVISHNDYIVEGTDSIIKYSEYLKEQTENLSGYVHFVVEKINEGWSTEDIKTAILEEKKMAISKKSINESIKINNDDEFKKTISSQLSAILESAKSEVENKIDQKYHFFQFLGESKKREFDAFNKDTQNLILETFENTRFYGTADALRIWESCFAQPIVTKNWLTAMPEKYLTSWNSLNESQKNSIKAQASTRVLDTQYKIDNFWQTRDLREVNANLINESLIAPITESSDYTTPDEYMEAVKAGFRARFKR